MLLMVINSEKRRGILTHSWQHLCSPFHALFLIKCVWLQHNTTFTLGSTVTEHYDLLRSLPVPRDTCFVVYVCVGGRLGFRKAGNWGDWNDKSLFASVVLFFSKSYVQIAWVKKSISRIPGEMHLLTFSFYTWSPMEAGRSGSITYIKKNCDNKAWASTK